MVLAFIYAATTLDSAAFILASVASEEVEESGEPARWHRLFWAVALGSVALTLTYLGGLKALQTSSVITAFPIVIIVSISVVSFVKWLREDTKNGLKGESHEEDGHGLEVG